jgi:acyl carrier protein phosphodiesterase
MNWLAHTFLSTSHIEFQLGNLLADVVRGEERLAMSAEFQRGAACHKAIDAFTDSHPIVKRSRARVHEEYRRFSGVLMDVFYDYCLAQHWTRYSEQPLAQFTSEFYAAASATFLRLPADAQAMLDRIIRHDSLGSYRTIEGVERALRRISAYLTSRWRKPFMLERSIPSLLAVEADLANDFLEFFPELQSHVHTWIREH